MNIEIREVGDKLRELRKKLGLKQDDLVKHCTKTADKEKTFTRNLVSMVETGKAPLTKKMAMTINESIDIACKKNNIEYDFDFEEVCKTPEEQVVEHINDYKDKIMKVLSLDESLKYAEELITLAKKYELLSELAKLYLLLGTMTVQKRVSISLEYYNAAYALVNYLDSDDSILLSKDLKKVYIKLGRYDEAIKVKFEKVEGNAYVYKRCLFNHILALKKAGSNECALIEIKKIKSILSSEDNVLSIDIKILEANIYIAMGNFKKFIDISESLLKTTDDEVRYIILLKNLVCTKAKLGIISLKEVEELASHEFSEEISQTKKIETLIGISGAYDTLNDKRSFEFLIKVLEIIVSNISISDENLKYLNQIINYIFDDGEKVKMLMESYYNDFKLLMHTAVEKELLDQGTLLKMIGHFLSNNENEFVKRLIERKIS